MSNFSFSEEEWGKLIPLLRERVARWVCTSCRLSWTRQRHDIIEDIVGEAIVKLVAYAQRAELGAVSEIDSLEKIAHVTAYHCYVDAYRRDEKIVPLIQDSEEPGVYVIRVADIDPTEIAIDNIYYELVFIQAARWIATFPEKQRGALLTDLANRMYFDPFQTTPLEDALASVGIEIRNYRKPLPVDKQARARHAAHLSLAYKRLAFHAYMLRYALVA